MTTNMLTWKELERNRAEGRLQKWLPSGRSDTNADGRCLYMPGDVYDAIQRRPWLTTQWHSPSQLKSRRQAMRAVLERFVTGSHLNLNHDMKELGSMKTDAAMQGFWEFRSGMPAEQTRLFGFFARPGAFVATSFQPRGNFGSASDPAWRAEREASENVWKSLFGSKRYLTSPWPVVTKQHFQAYTDRDDD
jgi:hypothetical protein